MTKSKRTSLKRQAVFAVFKQNIFLLMLGMDSLLRWWPKKKIDIFGKNDITHSSIPYYLWSFVMAFAFVVEQINPFLFLAVVYGVVPILDEIFIFDTRNPTSTQRKQLNKSQPYFLAPIYCGMILSWFVHVKAFTIISQIDLTWSNLHYLIALMYILSNVYTVQFVVAHELIHKNTVFNRILGTCYMVSLYYAHFTPHHINTHHKWVATPNDPNTPRKGEPLYDFVVRSMIDSWKGVYNDQKKEGKHFLANYAILSILASSVFAFLIFSIWGTQVAITHSLMALGAIFYLQTISYIEHYGLLRKKLPNGEYEKVTIMHSWNAPQRFTNYLFFKVQRHSDHHQNSSTPYQALCSLEQSPFMPHGYTVMIPLAFFPKVNMVQAQTWFRIMNPLLQAYQAVEQYRTKRADPEAIDTAVAETRKFMVKLTVLSFGLAMASVLDLI